MSIHSGQHISSAKTLSESFGDEYKLNAFMIWYNAGKPSPDDLIRRLTPDPLTGNIPATSTARMWINDIFIPKAIFLDEQVIENIDKQLVAQRIEMADRHAEVGRTLQEKGLKWLEENDISDAKTALTAIIRGVEIEHNARVVPTDLLDRLNKMSDKQLMDELKNMLSSGQILDISPNESGA